MLANSTLATAVSNRIWAAKLPDDEFASMPRDAVLIMPSGAIAEIGVPVYTERSDIYCYGTTPYAAHEIYRKLFNALHRAGLQSVDTDKRLMQAFLAGGPATRLEPEFGWAYVWSAWNAIWAENPMA